MLLQTYDLSVNFGPHQVLNKVNLKITKQSRIGLIGLNGAGKSTLLKCLTQELIPQAGSVSKAPNIQVQCLSQNPELKAGNSLEQELYSVFGEINDLKNKEISLTQSLESLSEQELEEALLKLAKLHEQLEALGASQIDAKIGRMVTGLGFSLEQLKEPVDNFSGGWQMRINLAKVLLQEADILLMDEPTNHLDREACEWLEEFLRNYPKGIVLVSHDRHFLNEVVTEIAELERGTLTLYSGNYTSYVEQRQMRREQLKEASQRQKKSMEKQMTFVNRFRASATKSRQAKSREKQLAKIEIIEAPQSELKRLSFKFPLSEPSGREVFKINNVSKSFENKTLFKNISAELEWTKEEPQRVFILGANGCGKTTLFKMLLGLEDCDTGDISFGNRVSLGYYAQHQLQILDPEKTALDILEEAMPKADRGEIRGVLGRFLFSSDQVFKKVETLSGGEKARLAIAKLMVGGPNTLLLDEPTNHLDTSAQEAIEDALRNYQGTVVCISHDRYLIENHATQIWEFNEGSLNVFIVSYEYYLEKREAVLAKNVKAIQETPSKKTSHYEKHQAAKQEEKYLKKLERDISKLLEKEADLTKKIEDPDISSDYKKLEELNQEIEAIKHEIAEKEAKWLELS